MPFNQFYMNEKIASKTEKIFRKSSIKKKNETDTLVAIKKGETVIKDVLINDVSIKDLANKK